MTTALAVLGVLVAAGSLLFSGWQARILSRQTAVQNGTAGAATMQQLFSWLHEVQGRLLDEPRLLPFFQVGEVVPQDLSPQENVRLRTFASMYSDVLTIGLFFHKSVPQTDSIKEWHAFCIRMLKHSEPIRIEVAAKPFGYPDLWPLLRDHFPEALQPTLQQPQPARSNE
ncbi:hypothetical protein ACQP00_34985 [Dactylosporangium sp. CS-047395]|uniref:hypothetical protein n=1 Tax=Dactylosporangium sp. CS-047395 TaxID=3239936 RepID=UPI003D9295AA